MEKEQINGQINGQVAEVMPTRADMDYLMEQSKGNMNKILSSMTELLSENDRKVEMLESQTWFQRMLRTITGKNKATKREIQNNHEKINVYISKAITELYQQNCLDREIITELGYRLNDLAEMNVKLKELLGALIFKLNEKIESVDRFHLLTDEIREGIYPSEQPFASLCRILFHMDQRTILEERRMRLLRKVMEKKGLFAKTERTLQEHLMEIMQIPDEEIGAIYLELQTMPDNKNAEAIRTVIEEYHFLPDEEKKRADREAIAGKTAEKCAESTPLCQSAEAVFLDLLNSKKNRILVEQAKAYRDGSGVPTDYEKAVAFYKEAARNGDKKAQKNLGTLYRYGMYGFERELSEAAKWFQLAADQGDPDAEAFLSDLKNIEG